MTRVLFDVNVVLDVLGARDPHLQKSAAALSLAANKRVRGFVAGHTITTLHYLLERELGPAKTRRALSDLLSFLGVAAVDEDRIRHALALGWRDFEDAVQAACAEEVEAEYLVTRNKRDFKKASMKVVSPAELVALIS